MTWSDALALGPGIWEAIQAQAESRSPFMSWEWHRAWADADPEAAAAQALVLHSGGGGGETVRAIMEDRVATAEAAGCDGIHPSGLEAFSASTGLDFDRADQLDYNRWLAAAVHARGLSI